MKSVKSSILSVLLFAFTFFILHDYVIVSVDADTQYELCYIQNNKSALDIPSQIHEHIHILLATPQPKPLELIYPLISIQTYDMQNRLISYISPVPNRPPLS